MAGTVMPLGDGGGVMVYYLSESGAGIDRYAETDSGVMDVPREGYWRGIEYAEPDSVHPSALQENVSAREQGYWVKPETMPRQYLWANGGKSLPDVLPGFVVSPRFKTLIEQFEPNVHQFVPVEIFQSRKGEPVATYYWFIVGQRIDSVDREHTTFIWKPSKYGVGYGFWSSRNLNPETLDFVEIPNPRLVFSNRQVEGHHIWHDPHVLTFNNGLCSDEFAEAVLKEGITGVAVTPRESA